MILKFRMEPRTQKVVAWTNFGFATAFFMKTVTKSMHFTLV